jgi:hypothetical protein
MSRRVISPPVKAFEELRQPLTRGEMTTFEMFDRVLPPEWEIYLQPHLNGLRPDFVLLNPKVGIGVFEVKDWDLDAVRYYVRRDRQDNPVLWGETDGKQFPILNSNPVRQVNRYKASIFNIYCPRLGEKLGVAAITAGVIFPFADLTRLKALFKEFLKDPNSKEAPYHTICGRQELAEGNMSVIFPTSRFKSSRIMHEALADDLRGWLTEPDFAAEQRMPLKLDLSQRSLVETWPESGYRRVKGPAGSGKSLVLGARAAKLANEGKSVLIATFNITLWHYLRDIVVRGLSNPMAARNIEFTHFHLWCKDVCTRADKEEAYTQLFENFDRKSTTEKNRILAEDVPSLANAAMNNLDMPRFDAILVDEGQDYQPYWWNTIRKVLKPDGQMLLVADATQDVYGTAKAWTDEAMSGAGFAGGRWAQLRIGYRLPPLAQKFTSDFARRFLPISFVDLPEVAQGSLGVEDCRLRWVQCSPADAIRICEEEILALMKITGSNGLANADVTFLTDDPLPGAGVAKLLSDRHVDVLSTFHFVKTERQREKMGFYMGDARIKATTLHSFKGWEARLLVVHVSRADNPKSLALIYAGLTRLKQSSEGSWLTVICTAPELTEYGQTWPEHIDHM